MVQHSLALIGCSRALLVAATCGPSSNELCGYVYSSAACAYVPGCEWTGSDNTENPLSGSCSGSMALCRFLPTENGCTYAGCEWDTKGSDGTGEDEVSREVSIDSLMEQVGPMLDISLLQQLDTNGDGYVNLSDLDPEILSMIDSDGDGSLDTAVRSTPPASAPLPRPRPDRPAHLLTSAPLPPPPPLAIRRG